MNVRVNTAETIAAARRVALVAERNTSLRMLIGDGVVTLEAATGDQAQASEAIEAVVDQPGGGDPAVTAAGFNPTYLLDALGAFDTPYVNFAFTAPSKPCQLTGLAELDGEPITDYRHVIMLMRLPSYLCRLAARYALETRLPPRSQTKSVSAPRRPDEPRSVRDARDGLLAALVDRPVSRLTTGPLESPTRRKGLGNAAGNGRSGPDGRQHRAPADARRTRVRGLRRQPRVDRDSWRARAPSAPTAPRTSSASSSSRGRSG